MTKHVLKQALEALEEIHHGNMTPMAEGNWNKAIEALRSALAQQGEQQPVAWMVTAEKQDGTRETYPMTGRYKDVKDVCDFGEPIPLYAAAPAAQPVQGVAHPACKPDASKVIEQMLEELESATPNMCDRKSWRTAIQAGQKWLEENK